MNATDAIETSAAFPTNLSSLITVLYSFTALGDWLKLIIIGGLFESCRRLVLSLYYKFINSFFIRASFNQSDASYGAFLKIGISISSHCALLLNSVDPRLAC